MTRRRNAIAALTLIGAAFLCTSTQALACAICLVAMNIAPGQALGNADIAVLARPGTSGNWKILTRLKPVSTGPVDLQTQEKVGDNVSIPGNLGEGQAELLVRDSLGYRWTSLGSYELQYADWLTELAAMPKPESQEDWQKRLALVAPMLECGDPGTENMAHGELARAPYPAYRKLGGVFSSEELQRLISSEENQSRRAAYILLLGLSDNGTVAAWLQERVTRALEENDGTDLAALLAAELEVLGPSHLEWIADNILLSPGISPALIEAALLALAVHGDENRYIPRKDIVSVHKSFIHAKPPMSDYVATKLMEWKNWSLINDYAELLEQGAVVSPAAEFTATLYVETAREALSEEATQK